MQDSIRLQLSRLLSLVYHYGYIAGEKAIDIETVLNTSIDEILENNEDTQDIAIIELIRTIYKSSFPYTKSKLKAEINIITDHDVDWEDWINDAIPDKDTDHNKVVLSYIAMLKQREALNSLTKDISKAAYELKHKRNNISNVSDYINKLLLKVENYATQASEVDSAISNEFDITNTEKLDEIFQEAKDLKSGTKVLKFGWQAMNTALQGGIRPGDCMLINALEHRYKSSMLRSLFRQVAEHNIPDTEVSSLNTKPTLVFISFEDPIVSVLQFIFQDIMHNKTEELVDIDDYNIKTLRETVIKALTYNGWHVIFMRVNPIEWNYRTLLSKLLSIMSNGHHIELLALDYLTLLPTVGCNTSGPTGTDLRDLIRRVRAFCSAKGIALMSPAQLSPAVKDMLNSGLPERDLLDTIAGRGLLSGSKQISQEIDISLLLNKVKIGDAWYLDCLIEKHRHPIVIAEQLKRFVYKFPNNGMPILEDIEKDTPTHLRKLPSEFSDF